MPVALGLSYLISDFVFEWIQSIWILGLYPETLAL